MDLGFDAAEEYVQERLSPVLHESADKIGTLYGFDPVSALQNFLHLSVPAADRGPNTVQNPTFRTLEYSTSENGQNGQKMGVYWNNELIGSAFGANAWAAKRNAAASTLKQLKAQHWGGKRG